MYMCVLQIMNFYMNLITERNKKVFAFSTFFYPKLVAGGYNGVSEWMKAVDIFSMELLLIPLHLQTHWCLATIDFTLQRFCYYDSLQAMNSTLQAMNSTSLQLLRQYIQQKSFYCKSVDYKFSQWPDVYQKNIPQKFNNSDCGVSVCMYARYLSERSPFCFTQTDIPIIRKHMVLELLFKKLL